MDLAGKHVLITGASSGIGAALATALLQRGSKVTSLERQPAANCNWTTIAADIRKSDDVKAALKQITTPIDILVNNAGIMRRAKILDHTEEEFDDLMDTHLKGSWLVMKYALPHLSKNATIVQMSSRHALNLPETPSLYGLSKRAAMDMATLIAKTYPQFTVKVLCPGPVDTPLAREGETDESFKKKSTMMKSPQEISHMIIELLESDKKSKMMFDAVTNAYFLE